MLKSEADVSSLDDITSLSGRTTPEEQTVIL